MHVQNMLYVCILRVCGIVCTMYTFSYIELYHSHYCVPQISIDWREKTKFGTRLEEVKETRVSRTAQFKLTDRNVTIFARGLSLAVL